MKKGRKKINLRQNGKKRKGLKEKEEPSSHWEGGKVLGK